LPVLLYHLSCQSGGSRQVAQLQINLSFFIMSRYIVDLQYCCAIGTQYKKVRLLIFISSRRSLILQCSNLRCQLLTDKVSPCQRSEQRRGAAGAALGWSPSRGRCLPAQFLPRTPGRGGKGLQPKRGQSGGTVVCLWDREKRCFSPFFLDEKLEKVLSA